MIVLFLARPLWEEPLGAYVDLSFLERMDQTIERVMEDPGVSDAIDSAKELTVSLGGRFQSMVSDAGEQLPETEEKPELAATDSLFAIHNVTLGMSKEEAQVQVGLPLRLMRNEYGTDWHSYHQDYQNYSLLSYDKDGRVNGMYTNQDIISSTTGLTMASTKTQVRESLGTPLTYIQKGRIQYMLDTRDEFDVFKTDVGYVTVFYDLHEGDTISAVQVVSDSLENSRPSIYAAAGDEVKQGFELLLFELTNSSRIQRQLPLLKWDEQTRITARAHSVDMAENEFFSHTNLEGQSPFDRMTEDGIAFQVAGENLAYGQYSSIFAHEGLMNSLGHRENIVNRDFGYLGVGAAFNEEDQPYYTAKFFNR
ncbi:CAP-associated domain-containing protein [Planomicrobium sp. YIM 101495]|uniref:CAP domain-containing protein n=1 Tax=Planomicrobium sp. YIM 101495 TaxID=2665160 RepID=UPI003519E0AA